MNESTYSTEILELLSRKSFDQLSETEQALVFSEMDSDTYTELHETYAQLLEAEQSASSSIHIPPISRTHFDALASRRSRTGVGATWFTHPVPIWQAAAMVLILLGVSIFIWQTQPSSPGQFITTVDTVYVNQPKELVYDTIYLERNTDHSTDKASSLPSSTSTTENIDAPASNQVGGLQILTLDQKDKINRKGNPKREQALLDRFGVVSM